MIDGIQVILKLFKESNAQMHKDCDFFSFWLRPETDRLNVWHIHTFTIFFLAFFWLANENVVMYCGLPSSHMRL